MDDIPSTLPSNTLYNLMQQLSALLDKRAAGLRRGSRYEDVRPSDVRTFVQVARKARSESEIAQVMTIPANTVATRIHHAKRKLRDCMECIFGKGEVL